MASITLSDYPSEILQWMKMIENKLPSYKGASPQLEKRDSLVNFIRQVCESLKLSVVTTHLGVQLLDRFMDCHNIDPRQLKLTALAGLFLAAKFEERDNNIPRLSELNSYSNMGYSRHLFKIMEAFMLKFFDWNVGSITVAHFAELYLMYSITPEDYVTGGLAQADAPIFHKQLWNSTQHFLDISLRDLKFLKYKSSHVAAACVICGRMCVHLTPTWPSTLEVATGYSLTTLSEIVDHILDFNDTEEKFEIFDSPDSGYQSSSGTLSSPMSDISENSF